MTAIEKLDRSVAVAEQSVAFWEDNQMYRWYCRGRMVGSRYAMRKNRERLLAAEASLAAARRELREAERAEFARRKEEQDAAREADAKALAANEAYLSQRAAKRLAALKNGELARHCEAMEAAAAAAAPARERDRGFLLAAAARLRADIAAAAAGTIHPSRLIHF